MVVMRGMGVPCVVGSSIRHHYVKNVSGSQTEVFHEAMDETLRWSGGLSKSDGSCWFLWSADQRVWKTVTSSIVRRAYRARIIGVTLWCLASGCTTEPSFGDRYSVTLCRMNAIIFRLIMAEDTCGIGMYRLT